MSEQMSDEEIQKWKDEINGMSREEMCRLWRFAPIGHACFVRGNGVFEHFEERFKKLGGFSPEISKKIG